MIYMRVYKETIKGKIFEIQSDSGEYMIVTETELNELKDKLKFVIP